MKKRNILLTLIILMIALIGASAAWIIHISVPRGNNTAGFPGAATGIASKTAELLLGNIQNKKPGPAAEHIYSHRGSEGLYEHSFKAYDEAIAAGSRYIEQDLVISSDGVLFVSHDLDAGSMTGSPLVYSSMTAGEIDSLQTKAGFKILRLSEVFDRYGKDINYVIELKSSGSSTIEAFEETVDSYGFEDVITVQSTDTEVLRILEEKYPDMPKLYVCKTQQGFNESLDLPYVDIISVKMNAGLMTQENCDAAHSHGKIFSAWTLSTESSIREAIMIGVDTYFTNDTELAMRLELEYGLIQRMKDR